MYSLVPFLRKMVRHNVFQDVNPALLLLLVAVVLIVTTCTRKFVKNVIKIALLVQAHLLLTA